MSSTPDVPTTTTVRVSDEAGLVRVAAALAATLPDRAVIALDGDLGAGKTTLVKAVAAAAGIDPAEVVSPTFGLIHVHEGPRGRLVHADLYRLASPAELRETGWEDVGGGAAGRACWVFVEWPTRITGLLPADRLDVAIGIDGLTSRTLSFTAPSSAYAPLLRALARLPRA